MVEKESNIKWPKKRGLPRSCQGNSLPNTPSRLRYSQKNSQAVEKERYPGEIELENKEGNKNWRFI